MKHPLDPLLTPASIALLGASERESSPGRVLAEMVVNSAFGGRVYPVHPAYGSIKGKTCYPDLASLPETVEHVVLAVANERLESALTSAIAHGAKAATIYSSCVLDNDTNPPLRTRLEKLATDAEIAVCGGNGMGFYNLEKQLYAGIFPRSSEMPAGTIAYIAQSGSAFAALAHNGVRLKFNLCVSTGNEIATTVADYMDWSLEQERTRVIGLFLETVRDPSGFVKALEKARRKQVPVVMLKVGKSPLGSAMALTHAGALSGNHAAYEALVKKYGIIEVDDFGELIAVLQTFQSPRRARSGELATIQESGGLMELATDMAHQIGVPFAAIADPTKAEIQRHLAPGLKADNPLDAWSTHENFEARFRHCLSALMKDKSVAAGMFVSTFRDGYYLSESFFRVVKDVSQETDKPLFITNSHADIDHEALCHRCRDAGIPFIDGIRDGLIAVKHLFAYRNFLDETSEKPSRPIVDAAAVERWSQRLGAAGKRALSELEGMELLADFSIRVPRVEEIDDQDALLSAAERIGYPLVLKTAEPGISHKSDQGGVSIGLADRDALLRAYRRLHSSLGPRALVCQMMGTGTEIGLGMVNDPQFGPLVMVSSGGILIELLEDRAVALAPLVAREAEAMIASLKSDALLRGARGQAAGNREALIDMIVAFSHMCYALRDQISEIDINPVIVGAQQAMAVDALVVTCPRGA